MNEPTLFDAMTTRGRARRSDPQTSVDAARLPGKVTLRARCLKALAAHPCGLTDFELAEIVGRQQTSAGKRRGELAEDGLVEATGERRPAPSGAMAMVWRATVAGIREAA